MSYLSPAYPRTHIWRDAAPAGGITQESGTRICFPALSCWAVKKNTWHTRVCHVFSHSPRVPLTHSHARTNTPRAFLFQCFEEQLLDTKEKMWESIGHRCVHMPPRETHTDKERAEKLFNHWTCSRQSSRLKASHRPHGCVHSGQVFDPARCYLRETWGHGVTE